MLVSGCGIQPRRNPLANFEILGAAFSRLTPWNDLVLHSTIIEDPSISLYRSHPKKAKKYRYVLHIFGYFPSA